MVFITNKPYRLIAHLDNGPAQTDANSSVGRKIIVKLVMTVEFRFWCCCFFIIIIVVLWVCVLCVTCALKIQIHAIKSLVNRILEDWLSKDSTEQIRWDMQHNKYHNSKMCTTASDKTTPASAVPFFLQRPQRRQSAFLLMTKTIHLMVYEAFTYYRDMLNNFSHFPFLFLVGLRSSCRCY